MPLYDEEALQVSRSGIRDRAVRTWLSIRPIFNNNEKKGYLVADGKPLSYQTLARIIGDRNPNNVKRDIEELVDIGIFGRDGDEIYSTWVVSDEESRRIKNETSLNHDDSKSDENLESDSGKGFPNNESDSESCKFRNTVTVQDSNRNIVTVTGLSTSNYPKGTTTVPEVPASASLAVTSELDN